MAVCTHCGYEAPTFEQCPLCGTPGSAKTADHDQAPGGATTGSRPPWEDPGRGFPRNFLDTWVESMLRPDGFFRGVPWDEPAARPVLYYLILTVVGATFALWWNAAFAAMGIPSALSDAQAVLELSPTTLALMNFFSAPFLAMIGLVIWGAVVQLLVMIFARERRGFGATLRALCYASAPTLLAIVPFLGGIAAMVWGLVLTGIGLKAAHRMSTGAVVGVMAIAIFGLAFVVVMALAFSYAALFTYS